MNLKALILFFFSFLRSNLSHVDLEAVEIGTSKGSSEKPDHSSPLNTPLSATGRSSGMPVLIESGSYSKLFKARSEYNIYFNTIGILKIR